MLKQIELKEHGIGARKEAQSAVVREFMDHTISPPFRLVVNYPTGMGKGKAAIDCAIAYYQLSQKPLFIGCHTEDQRDNIWQVEIDKWAAGHPVQYKNRRECYASMSKIKGQSFGLIVLDEAQWLTDASYMFFENNTYEAVIILTATLPRDKKKQAIIKRLTYGRRLVIKSSDAIESGVLNDYEVNVMMINLNNTEKYKLVKNSNTLYTDHTGYLKKCALVDQARRSGNSAWAKSAAIDRMRFLGECKSKTLAAQYIQEQFRNKGLRFLTFAASIEQADSLSQYTYHSKTSKHWKEEFEACRIDELISVNTLKESANFEKLRRALYVQPNSNPADIDQIKGRLQRLDPSEIAKLIILCAKGTFDEKWLNQGLQYIPDNKIKWFMLTENKYWK